MGDYRKLWQELGMELEKHDMLCEALPPLYEKVYLTQHNRPEAMGYFDFVISEIHGARVEELAVHNRAGGKIVGTFCVFVPTEIIQAAGGIAVGLCGGSQFWVPDGEKVLPRNLCPLIKGSVGAKISGTCPYFQFCDLLVGETTCDGKKKAWEVLGEYMPIHVMDLPQMKREKDYTAWRDEINVFVNKLEELTGNKINAENLAAAIKTDNARRQALMRLYEARKVDPVPISGKDALLISQIAFYDDPVRFADKTNEVCAELETRIAAGEGVFPAGAPRLLVTGTPQAIPNWKLHHLVESAGGAIVCEETCTGTRYFANLVNEEASGFDGQLQALADRYMGVNCACFTPNDGRVEDVLRLAKEYRVDGVIYYNLQFCHSYGVEYRKVERALKEAGIPVMLVETDYSEEDAGQISTRVEAFLEMLR